MANCEYVFILVANNLSLSSQIPTLTGFNFSDWEGKWAFVVSLLNINVAMYKPKPPKSSDASTVAKQA